MAWKSLKLRHRIRALRIEWVSAATGALMVAAVAGAAVVGTAPTAIAHAAAEASATAESVTSGGPISFRRLSEAQYKRSIEEIFSADIKVPGRFDPPLREEGLLAIGDSKVVVSASGLEQYELRSREIAAQVLAEDKRKTHLSCAPSAPSAFDRACATQFLSKYGRLLYRRPLTVPETTMVMDLAGAATLKTQDFYKGLEVGLARLLASPHFIFRVERSEPDPGRSGAQRLDAYSLATRISFLLWNASPDEELLNAAASGALRRPGGLEQQVDRLIASPRFGHGARAFFSDMLAFEQFDGLSKEQSIFPKFSSQMAQDAQEQALRTIVDLLITNYGDYRDLFTTRKTFVNRNMASLYQIPLDEEAGLDAWVPYTFGQDDPRAGFLTLAGFLMLDPAHEGRSSPTIRGKTVRELLLCQKVPDPPANVDFAAVQDINSEKHKTARQRLTIHMENPVCAGCHAITDPIGLAMENYDAIGSFRTHENGAPIDASGTFEGKPYKGLLDLARLLWQSPAIPGCLVQRTFEYGVGRKATASEEGWLEYAIQGFTQDQYRFPALMRRIATSKAFQAVAAAKVASVN